MKMQISSRDDCNVFTSTLVACAPQFSAPYDQNCNIQQQNRALCCVLQREGLGPEQVLQREQEEPVLLQVAGRSKFNFRKV